MNDVGRFGRFGGRYAPETVIAALDELQAAWGVLRDDERFRSELHSRQATLVGRPTPLYEAQRLTDHFGGARIHFKREDLCHTGSHALNNALGQVLLARWMGKRRIIADTGAGQHGVATATVCARFGLSCVVYMGAQDMRRQEMNVRRMRLLGAQIRPVTSGTATLKDAASEAIRDWVANIGDTYYVVGSVVGPTPYPEMVRELQRVIGDEAREQYLASEGTLPDVVVACVGRGSNSIGMFAGFVDDADVRLVGVQAGGRGLASGRHAATLVGGTPGVLHGSFSYILQDPDGQLRSSHSIAAGLDYPGVGPEHAMLAELGRARYVAVDDLEAVAAFRLCTTLEGIMPALETAHALHHVGQLASEVGPGGRILLCLSGRGDKDMHIVEPIERRGDCPADVAAVPSAVGGVR